MYELTYILNPNLQEQEVAAQADKVRGFINGHGGEIKTEKIDEKRKLAYPIKKQGFGFYVTSEFNLEAEKVEELEKQIRFDTNILRHLLTVKEILPPAKAKIRVPKAKEKEPALAVPKITLPKEKVKIEEIDKKLEELLEE